MVSCSPFANNRQNLWELDGLAQRYGQRPSSFLGLPSDSWEAYQLDLAAWTVGRWIDGKLSERDKKGNPVHNLAKLLGDETAQARQFTPVDATQLRKVRVKADGTWDEN